MVGIGTLELAFSDKSNTLIPLPLLPFPPTALDWDDSQTLSSAAGKASTAINSTNALTMAGGGSGGFGGSGTDGKDQKGAGAGTGDHLWEDNWDDDDREDEWSTSLKEHLAS